ncbi:MAG: PhoPQ-activated pathogenicity-related family protein [Candidatus Cyclobacteriaceae bacterium M3_2C_046]
MMHKVFLIVVFTFFFACTANENNQQTEEPVTPETALQSYLDNQDNTFEWEVQEEYEMGGLTAYEILLTSQTWREHVWTHQLTVMVPQQLAHQDALLYITGGSIKNGLPNWRKNDDSAKGFANLALANQAAVAILRQTPNQPLYDDLTEDELISFTLHNFKNDGDYTWPLLFPMVKSAIKAMDAIQEFSQEYLASETSQFTVCGASKRGWTTWLTAASDPRVEAIGPMVIDVLNMPVSLDYHVEAWNDYSVQIQDYTQLEIPQSANTPSGEAITRMVDPYSYREALTMPKMIFIGTNDEYWPVDAIKHYINQIPGENYIHYVPNAGHDLGGGEQALKALNGFWARTLDDQPYPKCEYSIAAETESATLSVEASPDELVNAYFWSADSEDRDFRDEAWSSKDLETKNEENINYTITYPTKGYKAFYIDLEYESPAGGTYTKSTRMYVADNDEVL